MVESLVSWQVRQTHAFLHFPGALVVNQIGLLEAVDVLGRRVVAVATAAHCGLNAGFG